MHLILGTIILRPYVFAFLAIFLAASTRDLGWRRTTTFAGIVWPLAWLAEFSSIHTGFPFGLYSYTGETIGQELFVAGVPFMDSLSFTFLAYASFCLARVVLPGIHAGRATLAILTGFLMMALDVVIDPLAVRGDRWFLGHIFDYAEPGLYFGVPLSNFAGWWLLGTAGVGLYLLVHPPSGHSACDRMNADAAPGDRALPPRPPDCHNRVRAWLRAAAARRSPVAGVGLYYAVLGFNLIVTAWIGEWALLALGTTIHLVLAPVLANLARHANTRNALSMRV
jgi:hypothetical protein